MKARTAETHFLNSALEPAMSPVSSAAALEQAEPTFTKKSSIPKQWLRETSIQVGKVYFIAWERLGGHGNAHAAQIGELLRRHFVARPRLRRPIGAVAVVHHHLSLHRLRHAPIGHHH